MELRIFNPTENGFIKEIEWNHEEIKKEVAERVAYYKNLVYTDDQIKEAKTDRATLNKFVAALDQKRKEIKKQCLAPYEKFEKELKEIIAIVNEPIAMIDGQVKEYEQTQREEKLEAILAIYNPLSQAFYDTFNIEFAPNLIIDEKWLNASVRISTVEKSIKEKFDQIEKDLETLRSLPEYSFEAIETYKNTLDINRAINEAHRLTEMAKKKAEAVAKEEAARVKPNEPKATETTANKQWIAFKALMSTEDAIALKQFFNDRNIIFEKI